MDRILHITNWYPNYENAFEALFVREHFESLAPHFRKNDLCHVQIREQSTKFTLRHKMAPGSERHFLIAIPFKVPTRMIEFGTFLMVWYVLWRTRASYRYDLLNLHIAYPFGAYFKTLKRLFRKPICITEHWSAYHFDFHLPRASRGHGRLRRLFSHNIPVIAVSRALVSDIERFAGRNDFHSYVVPNVVDATIFNKTASPPTGRIIFFTVNFWRALKRPLIMLEAFSNFVSNHPESMLVIGGYGPMWEDMQQFVRDRGLTGNVEFLGRLQREEVAKNMLEATAFIHTSSYETFSVVTAEALLCGTPVIVPHLPAIAEFVDESNGILVEGYEVETWEQAMTKMALQRSVYDSPSIRSRALKSFSKKAVGNQYRQALLDIRAEYQASRS